ncbi:Prefoldin [Niveomyces insectorum RCEF 264]|uniref:Prefoldin n=1 Tax=Niveomyces insectorum RCEF 264 TaxID=1081102 RepID=A0A167XSU1_9HYPO|nr:Prefoldin [Niveomyces insectorum RCEF 264]
MATDAQAALQKLSEEYTKLQKGEYRTLCRREQQQDAIVAQQRLSAQRTENEGVKKEFEKLQDGETIYKLIGPVLLKQDKFEADSTVKGRLDFITKEMSRLDAEIKESNEKIDKVKDKIVALQSSAQAGAQAQSVGQ